MSDLAQAVVEPPTGAHERASLSWRAETTALLRLAGPLVVTQLAQMAVMTTDVLQLGRLSTQALASAAIGNTVYYFAWLIGSGPAFAVAPVVAHLLGARPRDRAGVRAVARMGLWASALVCVALWPIMLSARIILLHLGQSPALASGAGRFVAALCWGLPFAIGFQVLRNLVAALGRPQAALVVTLASIGWNALVGWALIFGHFGAPRLGLVGGGLATSSSAVFGFLALLATIQLDPRLAPYRILRRAHRAHWPRLRELVRLGAPIALTLLFEAMLFNAMTLVVGTFGEVSVAAHQIALNFASFTFMVPLGVGMAATVRVGRAAGAGDREGVRRAGLVAMGVAAACVCVSALVMALAGREVAALYVPGRSARDLQVIALAGGFLSVAAAFQFFDALQVVGALSLRGMKDARMPMILAGVRYWLIGAPICIGLGVGLHMQGLACGSSWRWGWPPPPR